MIPGKIRDEILGHTLEDNEHEVCGLVFARSTASGMAWDRFEVVRIDNIHPSPTTHYMMDPLEQMKAFEKYMGDEGMELWGIYHSHPVGAAKPSKEDKVRAHYTDSHYLIVGAEGGTHVIRSYRVIGGDLVEEMWDEVR